MLLYLNVRCHLERQIIFVTFSSMQQKYIITIRAAIELQSNSNPSLPAPVQWDEADVTSQDVMLQFMVNYTLTVRVPLKRLEDRNKVNQKN